MKNLFNSISQEEKNRILEMHSGKKNVISEDDLMSDMTKNSTNVIPRDYVLAHREMGQVYPFLIKKGTPIKTMDGKVNISCIEGESISNNSMSSRDNYDFIPNQVKFKNNATITYICGRNELLVYGGERIEISRDNSELSSLLKNKFCLRK